MSYLINIPNLIDLGMIKNEKLKNLSDIQVKILDSLAVYMDEEFNEDRLKFLNSIEDIEKIPVAVTGINNIGVGLTFNLNTLTLDKYVELYNEDGSENNLYYESIKLTKREAIEFNKYFSYEILISKIDDGDEEKELEKIKNILGEDIVINERCM